MTTETTRRTYAEPNPLAVADYIITESEQTDAQHIYRGHVTTPCRHCGRGVRALSGNPRFGWLHDGGEEACPEMDGTDV